ncbi:MAG: A/G-specific adenine glycosylase [Vicingaceae bacterium]
MTYLTDKSILNTAQLIDWYHLNKRDLPWRLTKNPYKIWLSEIILQQTRVAQGTSYYLKFTSNYPTVNDLAEASEEEVLKDWQGLGYYSRARNLHAAAKFVANEMNGIFPNSYASIRELKGVGDYTSAAIASFAFDLPHAVVDGNVYRVLSRLFGIETPIDSTQGKKQFASLAQTLLPIDQAAEYNQAIMEFGAIQCTPKTPKCHTCPFSISCTALKSDQIERLPIKGKKVKQKKRYLNYLILESDDELLVNKRDRKGIWQNLYDFPMVESVTSISERNLSLSKDFQTLLSGSEFKIVVSSKERKHILSHQILFAKFYHIYITDKLEAIKGDFEQIKKTELANKPIPKLIENYLREETNLLSLSGSLN